MPRGVGGGFSKNVAELSHISSDVLLYAKKYIKPATVHKNKDSFLSVANEDLSVFSNTDIECLETVYNKFSDKDQYELAEMTHEYSEWSKHKRQLDRGKRSIQMNYGDFFADGSKDEELFKQSKQELSFAKESFKEREAISSFFSG